MKNYLKIENTDVSQYIKELEPELEIIWDENAGRTLTGDFVGDIINQKWKLPIVTRPLNQEESALIMNLIMRKKFMQVSFIPTSSANDELITKTFYVSSPAHKVYTYNDEYDVRYESMTFSLVEQ